MYKVVGVLTALLKCVSLDTMLPMALILNTRSTLLALLTKLLVLIMASFILNNFLSIVFNVIVDYSSL